MVKRGITFVLSALLMVSMVGCAGDAETVSKEDYNAIKTATDNLVNSENPYIISSLVEAPDGAASYIECVNGTESYTEYSVDSDGNVGTIAYGGADTISYMLTDWLTSEGNYYMFYSDGADGSIIYNTPKTHANNIVDRNSMYVSYMLDKFTSVENKGVEQIDIGYGVEDFTVYECKLPAEDVKHILGLNSYGLYDSVMQDEGADSNIGKLCSYYLSDLDMNLTFSDGIVVLGVDSSGVLKYMCLETGGLGTRMYISKIVVDDNNENLRQTPDFSVTLKYSETLKDLADFVASYPTYQDALNALNSGSTIEDMETSTELTTESVTTEELNTTSESVTEDVTEVDSEVTSEDDTTNKED